MQVLLADLMLPGPYLEMWSRVFARRPVTAYATSWPPGVTTMPPDSTFMPLLKSTLPLKIAQQLLLYGGQSSTQ